MADEFDVQRQSPYTPEGQIEAAGRFSRGLAHRYGSDRVRRIVGRVVLGAAVMLAAFALIAALG